MIRQGHLERREFEGLLRTLGPVDTRLLLRRAADDCSLVSLVVNAGRASAGEASERYDYGEVILARADLDGGALAGWLSRGAGELADLTFAVPKPSPGCTWKHRESRQHATHGTLFATPHTEYRLSSNEGQQPRWPAGVLAGPGLPFYPHVDVAAASVLLDIDSLPGGRTIPSELVLLRIAYREAYFEKLRVSSTAIVASVRGADLAGVRLQVSWAGNRHEEDLARPGDVRVPVAGAGSTDTWVALARGRECLDFRAISSRWPDPWGQRDIVFDGWSSRPSRRVSVSASCSVFAGRTSISRHGPRPFAGRPNTSGPRAFSCELPRPRGVAARSPCRRRRSPCSGSTRSRRTSSGSASSGPMRIAAASYEVSDVET